MAGTKRCKVCGREYEYCRTNRPTDIFRWQDVACSPEHGAIYFAQIAEARGETIGAQGHVVPSAADNVPMAAQDSMLLSELDGEDDSFSSLRILGPDEVRRRIADYTAIAAKALETLPGDGDVSPLVEMAALLAGRSF